MIGVCQLSFQRLNPAPVKWMQRRGWCYFPAHHIRPFKDDDWLKHESVSLYQERYNVAIKSGWKFKFCSQYTRTFPQSNQTQNYVLKQFIINRSTIAKLKLPSDMTVLFHLLASPLVITSCQNGFLYNALATSCGSDLKNKKKKEKRKKKQQKKTVHQIVYDSSAVPSLVKGMSLFTDSLSIISTF